MSYVKIAKVMCDGPRCKREVYADTAAEARRFAKYGQAWFETRKYGLDFCSESCSDAWLENYQERKRKAENLAEADRGTLDTETVPT